MTVTIEAVHRKVQYTSTGSLGPYSFSFKVLAAADIKVSVDTTVKTVSTHYTTTYNSDGTGSVTFTSGNAPAADTLVTIESDQAIARTSDYATGGDFTASSINNDLDRLTINDQQLQTTLTRNIQLAGTTSRTTSGTGTSGALFFPFDATASNNANKVIQYDSDGTSLQLGPTATEISAASTQATNAANSATAAASSASGASTSATNAASSASTASTQATTATTKASEASTSASNASTSASTASTQATTATTKATQAASSATAAASSATAAASSATSAASSQSSATSSASTATTQASNASTSASTASTQASNASTSATAAASSATAASNSATAAASGQLYSTVSNKTSDFTATTGNDGTYFICDTSSGNITVTLPTIGANEGLRLAFQKSSASNQLILDPQSTDTVNGSTSNYTLSENSEVVILVADDASPDNWVATIQSQTVAGDGLTKTGSTMAIDYTRDQAWTGSQRSTPVVDNDGSFDMNAGNNFTCTPSGNFALTFTNITSGQGGLVYLVNSGGHTVTKDSAVKADANFLATVTAAGTYLVAYYSPDGTSVVVTNSLAVT